MMKNGMTLTESASQFGERGMHLIRCRLRLSECTLQLSRCTLRFDGRGVTGRGLRIGKRILTAMFLPLLILPAAPWASEVNVYTDRQEVFLRDVFAEYTRESGDIVNTLFVKKGLLERVKAEGISSPADIFLVADIGRLVEFVKAELTAPVNDSALQVTAPALRDIDGQWFAVTRRARALYLAPTIEINSYAALAAPRYRNMICMRAGAHPYNNALFADIIAKQGRQAAKEWLENVRDNLARSAKGSDRSQINGVANGECKIGVANSYYYFHLLHNADESQKEKLQKVRIVIPPQAHINITGMALAKNAPHKKSAIRLMKFLLSKKAQEILATRNFEFPARDDVQYPPQLLPFQNIIANTAPDILSGIPWRRTASELVDETNFDRN